MKAHGRPRAQSLWRVIEQHDFGAQNIRRTPRGVGDEKAPALDVGDVDAGQRDRGAMSRLGDLHLITVCLEAAHAHRAIPRHHTHGAVAR